MRKLIFLKFLPIRIRWGYEALERIDRAVRHSKERLDRAREWYFGLSLLNNVYFVYIGLHLLLLLLLNSQGFPFWCQYPLYVSSTLVAIFLVMFYHFINFCTALCIVSYFFYPLDIKHGKVTTILVWWVDFILFLAFSPFHKKEIYNWVFSNVEISFWKWKVQSNQIIILFSFHVSLIRVKFSGRFIHFYILC